MVKPKFIKPDVSLDHSMLPNDSLIKPYIPDCYSLPSSSSYIDKIKELKLTNDAKLVSFDVTSRFTNISEDLVVDHIANKLFSYDVTPELSFYSPRNQFRKTS